MEALLAASLDKLCYISVCRKFKIGLNCGYLKWINLMFLTTDGMNPEAQHFISIILKTSGVQFSLEGNLTWS